PILTIIHRIVDLISAVILGIVDPIFEDTEGSYILYKEEKVFQQDVINF
ncbi:838_t:CDS:1, partial [Funneliformis geosporum]